MVVQGACLRLWDVLKTGRNHDFLATFFEPPSEQDFWAARQQTQRQWQAAIAALEQLLLMTPTPEDRPERGLILTGPMPVISHPDLLQGFYQGVFTPKAWQTLHLLPSDPATHLPGISPPTEELPLFSQDPLATEQFCLVLTDAFGLLMVLGEGERGLPAFDFSFEPDRLNGAWLTLRSRLNLRAVPQLSTLDQRVERFAFLPPDYRLVSDFSRQLLKALAGLPSPPPPPVTLPPDTPEPQTSPSLDVELLQALTHEIRTPLTSIRTLTRLLLRKKNLGEDVRQRLQAIDQECTLQIDRMELIFRATELESHQPTTTPVTLVLTSLDQMLESRIPRWQAQAQRHQVELVVELPQKLPQVVSNPGMLDQILTGLIEKFVRSLAQGGKIRLQVSTAGPQLKVQFHTQANYLPNPLKALGDLLMFQPDTGCLSLNLTVTKNLFQVLGGKLTIKQRSEQEEVFTIYLPLDWQSPQRA
ncbi:MAG: sensor histidine kinase [Microcystaceae cyanobacterium]